MTVLDASTVLALVHNEPGSDIVAEIVGASRSPFGTSLQKYSPPIEDGLSLTFLSASD